MSNGELIRQARKRKNWTQGDLAKALGITHVNVAQWENGTRNPKTETLERIAEALDIDPLDLMDGNERLSYIEQFGSTAIGYKMPYRSYWKFYRSRKKMLSSAVDL